MLMFETGEKLHIIERRYFEHDLRRHFLGEVVKCSDNAIRCIGYVWVHNQNTGNFDKKPELRERVFNLSGDNRLTINVIPKEVEINTVTYQNDAGKGLIVTDGKDFNLDINEFSSIR